ncbi:MAG: DMT family transporter, partial [Bacteroidetes bacterium]
MTHNTKAHLAVLSANLLFALNFSMVKLVTPLHMTSYALNMARIGISVPLFWLLYLAKPSRAGIQLKHLPRFLACALTGVAINQLLFVKGLSLTSSIHGALLILGTPIFITAAAGWLLHERFSVQKGVGLAMGVGGAALLILWRQAGSSGQSSILGDVYVLINTISYALYFAWVRPLMKIYPPIHVMRWVFTLGMFMIMPFGLTDLWHTNFASFHRSTWLALSFVVLGATFLSYLFNIYGIKYLGPAIVGNYIYTQPLFATLIGVLFLQEHLGWPQVVAALMIGTGV